MEGQLAEAVASLEPVGFEGEAFRHVAAGRNPLSGAGARTIGGRWNPPESFTTLYLALDRDTAIGEFYRLALRSNLAPESFLPRRLYRCEAKASTLLDVRPEAAAKKLGLARDQLMSDDLVPCQSVGEVAHYLGFEGILAPSAVGRGFVLVLYFDRLAPRSYVQALGYEDWSVPPSTDRT